MKRMFIIFIVICLPLFAQAGLLSRIQQTGKNFPKSPNRDFRLTHEIMSDNEEGVWLPSAKTVPHYSNSHPSQVESIQMYSWDEGDWGAATMTLTYEYNAAGMVISSLMQMDLGGQVIPFSRSESTFDAQNRITRYETYSIDFMDFETWVPNSWDNFEYGPNHSLEMFSWENTGGDNQYFHSTFDYDSSGRITEELSYASVDSEEWVFDTKDVLNYHPQDNSTGADYIAYLSKMYGSTVFLMDWNIPILITSATSSFWNGEIWISDYRSVWDYDGSLRRSLQTDEDWLGDGWIPTNKTVFHYDSNGNMASVIMQENFGGSWEDESKIEYFWEGYTSSEDLVQDVSPTLQIKAWPMPFAESLNISTSAKSGAIPQISIYNSRGQLVREFTGSEKLIWDGKDSQGRDSANGLYFIRANQNNSSAVRKVIRVK